MLEFTHSGEGLLAPIVLAVASASYTASVIDHLVDRRLHPSTRHLPGDDWVL